MARLIGLLVTVTVLWFGVPTRSWAQNADPWKPVERLIGDWRGTVTGQAGSGDVTRRYAKVMGGRFIQETNVSTYLPQEQNKKGEVHEHSGMFSYDKQRKVLMLRLPTAGGAQPFGRQGSRSRRAVPPRDA